MPKRKTIEPTNRGQEALLDTGLSLNVIARATSVSVPSVSKWRNGEGRPRKAQRESLENAYGIPFDAWDEPPNSYKPTRPPASKSAPAPQRAPAMATDAPIQPAGAKLPPYPRGPDDDASTLDHIRYSLICVRHDLKHRPMTAAGRSKVRADETRTLALIAKLEGAEELSEARYVKSHPEWKRLRKAIMGALEPYPDAALAVLEAIEGVGEE